MASPRPPKEDAGQPNSILVGGGLGAATDRVPEIYQKLGGIERSVTYLEAHSADTEKKIDRLSESIAALTREVSEAKTIFATIQPIVAGATKALWAIAIPVIVFLLSVLGMWIKHRMGW